MDKKSLRALVSTLQLLSERPRRIEMRSRVRGVIDGAPTDAVVVVNRVTGGWSVQGPDGDQRSGLGAIVPFEAALLIPRELPIWGRFEDSYSPIHAERTPNGFRVVSRHKEIPTAVCGVTLRAGDQVATSFFAPDYSLTLVDDSGTQKVS